MMRPRSHQRSRPWLVLAFFRSLRTPQYGVWRLGHTRAVGRGAVPNETTDPTSANVIQGLFVEIYIVTDRMMHSNNPDALWRIQAIS
ncbi:hypothetical protein AAMO2058_000049300 [Amorphochlora amoebiformis]